MPNPSDTAAARERLTKWAADWPAWKCTDGVVDAIRAILTENEELRTIAAMLASLESEDRGRSFPTREMCAAARAALSNQQGGGE